MKKFIFVLLALSLLVFAACGGNGDGGNNVGGERPADTPPPTGGEAATVEEGNRWGLPPELGGGRLHEARDFGGRTLVIGAWWDTPIGAIAWGDEPDRATAANYPVARMMWDNARRVEEVFNVRFEPWVVGFDDYLPTLSASVIAGVPAADVVILEGWMQLDAMGSIIQPWDNANLPGSDIMGAQLYGGPTTQNENGIWAIYQHGVFAESFGLGINLDIINAEGLPNPIDLFEAGQWTWDAMLDIMRRATRDTDGDGVDDQFGIAGQPGDIVQHLIASNDGIMVDAYLNYGFSHPNTVRALEFAEQIFRERLWHAEAGGIMDTGNWNRNFYSGFEDGVAAMFPSVVWAFQNAPPAFNFGFVPFPTGPNNRTGNTWSMGMRQGLGVTVGTSWDIADILILIEELYSWPCDEPELLFEAGGIDWLREQFLTEEDVQRVVYAGITIATDVGRDISGYYWVLGNFASHFWNNEMDVMQAIEYNRGPHQEMLDQRFR